MKKTISLIITAVMLISSAVCLPFTAFAGESISTAEALEQGVEKEFHFTYGKEEASPRCWFTFTPDKDGAYQFSFTNKNTAKVWTFWTRMYSSKKNADKGVYIDYDGDCYYQGKEYADINPHFYTYTLKQGVTYYLDVYIFADESVKELDVPVLVSEHAHNFKDFYRAPVADEPGDEEEGEYGKICKTCGYEKDIKTFKRPSAARLSSLTGKKRAFTAGWKKVKGVKGYQIQYSTSPKFTKKTTNTKLLESPKTLNTTVKKLKKNKKYYVRIRTYTVIQKHKVYSKWSEAKTVKVK